MDDTATSDHPTAASAATSSSSFSISSSSAALSSASMFPEGGTVAMVKKQMLQSCKQLLSPPSCVTSLVSACVEEFRAIYRHPREALLSFVNLLCVLFTALMLWKVLVLVSNSPSPVVVVLSGSMEPAFFRGDILFLVDRGPKLDAGDIIVFKVEGRDIPIVHRVLSLHEDHSGNVRMLTKGDNNSVDDRGLYAEKQLWLQQENVMGTTVTFLPSVGLVTILLNSYPLFKWGAIAIMVVLALLGYE